MARRETEGWHAESRFTTVAGVRCHYLDLGPRDGDVVVLVHGIAVSSWAWRHNAEVLATRHRVIVPCQKGFGWSGRDTVACDVGSLARFVLGLCDELGVQRAHFVGNSLGGAVSLWIAQNHPERVASLVLVNPAALVDQRPWGLLHTQRALLAPIYRALLRPSLLRAGLMALAYRDLPVDSGYMAAFWTPMRARRSMRTLLAVARKLPRSLAEIDRRLDELRDRRCLIVWGALDGILPVRGARALARRLPNARLVLFERAGHCPQEENPERFNALLLRFLEADPEPA